MKATVWLIEDFGQAGEGEEEAEESSEEARERTMVTTEHKTSSPLHLQHEMRSNNLLRLC